MKEKMLEDLHYELKEEEYMNEVRISILFNHSGGKLTPAMNAVIMIRQARSKTHPLMQYVYFEHSIFSLLLPCWLQHSFLDLL